MINNTTCAFGPKFVNCYFDELDFENLTWLKYVGSEFIYGWKILIFYKFFFCSC